MAVIGHGSKLQIVGTTNTDLACISIDLGSEKTDTPDTTDMLTSGHTRTFTGGLEDPGDVTAKMNVKPGDAGQAALYTAKDTAAHDFKVIYPGAVKTVAFSGIITSIDESITDDKPATLSVKIKVTGAKTITYGS